KKEIIFLLYTIQTLACLFYTYIYEAGDYTNHFFIIIALSFLESGINYSEQNAKTFFLKMLLNLSFYILLTEEFAILCGLAIILTDLNINMRLKSNTGDWLKNTYAIVFRSLILLFFLSLIILSSGSLSFNVTIQNKNLAYLAILFGQISI